MVEDTLTATELAEELEKAYYLGEDLDYAPEFALQLSRMLRHLDAENKALKGNR